MTLPTITGTVVDRFKMHERSEQLSNGILFAQKTTDENVRFLASFYFFS